MVLWPIRARVLFELFHKYKFTDTYIRFYVLDLCIFLYFFPPQEGLKIINNYPMVSLITYKL